MLERSEEDQRYQGCFHTVTEIGHIVLGVIVVTSGLVPLLAGAAAAPYRSEGGVIRGVVQIFTFVHAQFLGGISKAVEYFR